MADYWIKLYIEILDDPKMAMLPDRLWRRIAELFLLAGKLGKKGQLPDTHQIAWLLRMNADELDLDLKQIAGIGIIEQTTGGWYVKNFEKRQGPSSAAERKRAQRERARHSQYDDSHEGVTIRDNSVSDIVRQINRLTDTEAEAEEEGQGSPKPKKKTSATMRGAAAAAAGNPENGRERSDAEASLENLYVRVTGQIAIPGTDREKALEVLHATRIAQPSDNAAVGYLQGFYKAWRARHYAASNMGWLTDWAAAGEVPRAREPEPTEEEKRLKRQQQALYGKNGENHE